MKERIRRQPSSPGVRREQISSCVLPAIREAIRKEAYRWNCSRSYVEAEKLANAFGIPIVSYKASSPIRKRGKK